MESSQDGNAHYGYSGTGNVSDTDLVDGFLIRAEALYGPRFQGVTFEVQESPTGGQLHSESDASANHVIIRLPAGQSEHDRAAQLAQESIHVLSPAVPDAKVFDIGRATLFAVRCNYPPPPPDRYEYRSACMVVEWLDHLDPNAIKELRLNQPRVALIEENEIHHACRGLPR
jgi:hypothetical protein